MAEYTREVPMPGKNAQEIYERLSKDVCHFMEKISIGKFDLQEDAQNLKIFIHSSLVQATLTCEHGKVQVNAKLSLLASPFRSKIDEGIDRWLRTLA